MPIKTQLIVGLGNPGAEYADTRHNVGAWFVEMLATQQNVTLHLESKFKARIARLILNDQECWLLIPNTFMNVSGQSVRAFAHFYKIDPEAILVAHDDLDFPSGVIRLKQGGGAGGHNGLRDIIAQLPTPNFGRLRIGIGHPGDRNAVHDYVLNPPSRQEQKQIIQALEMALPIISDLMSGDWQKAMRALHTSPE